MAEQRPSTTGLDRTAFDRQIRSKAARKLRARRQPGPVVWSGLGMMGLIGWSVVVPTLMGVALGIWLDDHHPTRESWTLSLMVVGLVLGCWNAWLWVTKEGDAMREELENDDE